MLARLIRKISQQFRELHNINYIFAINIAINFLGKHEIYSDIEFYNKVTVLMVGKKDIFALSFGTIKKENVAIKSYLMYVYKYKGKQYSGQNILYNILYNI